MDPGPVRDLLTIVAGMGTGVLSGAFAHPTPWDLLMRPTLRRILAVVAWHAHSYRKLWFGTITVSLPVVLTCTANGQAPSESMTVTR